MRQSQRLLPFSLLLLYAAALVAGCFLIWGLDQLAPEWRLILIGVSVIGWSWSMSEDMRLDQLLPRSRGTARNQDSA